MEFMRNIAYLMKYFNMGYFEIMELPYAIFLSLQKWATVFQLEQTQEGRDVLYKESAIHQTEADLDRIRKLQGYQVRE